MKSCLISLLIVTIIFIFITLYIIFNGENNKNEKLTICGILWAMISVFITLLLSILSYQSDDIDIIFKDGRSMSIKNVDTLILNKEGLNLSNNTYPDYYWYINLCNDGNMASKNIKGSPEYYKVTDGRYSMGGYKSLLYDVSDIILPETCVSLHAIDFTKSYIDKDLNSDKMTIYIYTESNKSIKKEYSINLRKIEN